MKYLARIFIHFLIFILFPVYAYSAEDELVAVTAIYRHGARTPLFFYPNDPHSDSPIWTAAPGDLTNVGKHQMYELGRWLRQRYDSFLTETYKKEEIYVFSSDEDRCISSAAATLAGLYPPKQCDVWNPDLLWQPIPVHTAAKRIDDIFQTWKYFLINPKLSTKFSNSEEDDIKNLYEYLAIHTGKSISHLMEAILIRDTLSVEEYHNLTLPQWTNSVYPHKLAKLRDKFYLLLTSTPKYTKIVVGRLLYEILQQFDRFDQEPSIKINMPKMRMFSAHDINIHFILKVFEVPHSLDIPYAATLLFELRRMKTGKLYVQLVYNVDKTDIIPLKNNSLQCGYEDFKIMLKENAVSEEEHRALISSLQ